MDDGKRWYSDGRCVTAKKKNLYIYIEREGVRGREGAHYTAGYKAGGFFWGSYFSDYFVLSFCCLFWYCFVVF